MNIQAALDQTALIAGGALLRTGIYKGAGGISGVKIAYSLPPENSTLVEEGPAHISFWDGVDVDPDGVRAGDLTVFRNLIRMQLCVAIGPSELPKAISLLTPFVPLYIAAFGGKVSLNGTCASCRIDSSAGIIESIYPDRIALEFKLLTTIKEAVPYAP